ncbi:MAG TPA: hypothetical protein V6C81_23870 [Planktothrix sp.]|jgi:hypothetical protein
MTQKPAPTVKKKQTVMGAITDLLVLVLIICAAGFGGYFWGTHQKMAIVDLVPPGTPNAREMVVKPAASTSEKSSSSTTETTKESATQSDATPTPKKSGKVKYWLASTGDRMVGYSISATVDDTPVDNFFAPGKTVDVTDLVKKGNNTVKFEAKELEDNFNQHKGEKQFALTVQLVKGATITDAFKPSDVVVKYRRNAAESGNFSEEMDFTTE